jgi:dihydrofolate reductase
MDSSSGKSVRSRLAILRRFHDAEVTGQRSGVLLIWHADDFPVVLSPYVQQRRPGGLTREGAHMASSVIVDIFVSVDGWAGSDGLPGYFGYLGPELQEWIMDELAEPQLVVMGRRTYQALAGLPEEAHGKSWGRTAELDKVVFSRTLTHAAWPNTRICSRDLVDEIQEMKAGGSLPLRTWGSLSLVRQLIGAGLVDRLRLMTFPLLAGPSGRDAAFADMASADLELAGHRVLDGRVLLAEYRPTDKDIPRA